MKTVKNEFANYVGVLLGKKWFSMQQAKRTAKTRRTGGQHEKTHIEECPKPEK